MPETRNESASGQHFVQRDDASATSNDADFLHELLTVEEVAALLRVDKTWVYQHTRSGAAARDRRLPHIKIGKYLRFERDAVRAFIRQQKQRG